MDYQKYKFADLSVFIFLALATSFASEYFYVKFPNSMLYLNFGFLIAMIAIVRWGPLGSLAFLASGIPIFFYRMGMEIILDLAFYVLANSFIVLSVFVFRFIKKDRIHHHVILSFVFLFSGFLFVGIGKGIVLGIAGENVFLSIYQYLVAELFNFIISMIAFLFISKVSDGLVVDMKAYILSMQGDTMQHD